LRSRYEQMFRTEAGQAVGKSRKRLEAEALEILVSEVAGIVIDNAKDYQPTQGPVVDWLRACAWVAAVFSLRRNDHWPADEDPAPWLSSRFKVHYKDYPNDHLARVARQCPLKERKKKKLLFFQAEADERPGCETLCVLLHTE